MVSERDAIERPMSVSLQAIHNKREHTLSSYTACAWCILHAYAERNYYGLC